MRWTARDIRSLGEGLVYLAPSLVLFAVFVFIPLGRTFYLSLFNTRVTGQISTFNGIDHYLDLITSATFRNGLVATALFALYTVPVGIALGLVLAVLLNQRLRGINVFRTMMSSTIAISAAAGCSPASRSRWCRRLCSSSWSSTPSRCCRRSRRSIC